MRYPINADRGVCLLPPCRDAEGREVPLLLHDRRQMPVGQGGFHVGALHKVKGGEFRAPPFDDCARFAGAEFLYVYDCGAVPKAAVENEIRDLLKHRPERKLDILFLSHFDTDHICGTPRLLGADRKRAPGFTVDTIVLPYVDDAERLLAFARASTSELEGGARVSAFFRDMVIDPGAALGAFGPRQIIFIEGDERPSDEDVGSVFDPDVGPWSGSSPGVPREGSLRFKVEGIHDGADYLGSKFEVPQRPVSMRRLGFLGQRVGSVSMLLASSIAFHIHDWVGSFGWRLLPYVRSAPKGAIAVFERAAEEKLHWPKGEFRKRVTEVAVRKELVTRHRMKLASAYGEIFGKANKNLTSLSLYSGPANFRQASSLVFTPWLAPRGEAKISWLGTGDAPLKTPADISAFEQFYAAELDHVSSFMLPHHGSIENSDPEHLISDADIYIAAADPCHAWEHPSETLCDAVFGAGKRFHVVRAQRRTALDESFLVVWG